MKSGILKGNGIKIFLSCTGVACVFWILNSLTGASEKEFEATITYTNLPPAAQTKSENLLPQSIKIIMSGSGFDYLTGNISKTDARVSIDYNKLRSEHKGEAVLTISSEKLVSPLLSSLNTRMKLIRVIPDSVKITVVESYFRKVPLVADYTFTFQKQFMQSGPLLLYPDSVIVSGDKNSIDKIDFIKTEKLMVNSVHGDFFRKINLLPPYHSAWLSQKFTWIYMPVDEYAEGKIKSTIRKANFEQSKVMLKPEIAEITYRAPIKYFKKISETDFTTEVDFSCYPNTQKTNKMRIEVTKIPKYTVVTSVKPAYIDYFFNELK